MLNVLLPICVAVSSALVFFVTSAFTGNRSWYLKEQAKISWLGLCSIGAAFSAIMGSLAAVFLFKWDGAYSIAQTAFVFYAIETTALCAYHAVVASWSDLVFRKVSRSMLVTHMMIQAIVTTAVLIVVPGAGYLIAPLYVSAFICWASGLIPGGGMSDGRMFSLYCLALLPLFQTTLWIPMIGVVVLALIWAVVAKLRAKKAKTVEEAVSILKTMFPVAPLLAPCMLIFVFAWPLSGQIIPFLMTTGVVS